MSVVLLLCMLCSGAFAQEPASSDAPETSHASHTLGADLLETLHLSGVGFVHQFTHWQAGALWGAGASATALSFVGDVDGWQLSIEDANLIGRGGEVAGDVSGLLLSVGLVNAGFYIAGRGWSDERAIHFAQELSAVMLITNLETLLLSHIPVHDRPVEARGDVKREDQPFYNLIRGPSSFPSGHVIGPSALAIKGWEFYGWPLGLPASVAALFVGYARVQEGQHYLADVVASYALVAVACWSVSSARAPFGLGNNQRSLRWLPYAHSRGAGVLAIVHY